MKLKVAILFITLLQCMVSQSQEKSLQEFVEEFFKELDTKRDDFKIEKGKNYFIGKTIGDLEDEDWIYFVNDKYCIYPKYRQNNLSTYKLIESENGQVAVLLDDDKNIKGFFSPKSNDEFWFSYPYSSEIETYKTVRKDDSEKEIDTQRDDVKNLNYNNPKVILYSSKGKIGIKYEGKKILPTECDSLDIYCDMAVVFTSHKKSLYTLSGSLLAENIKAYYLYSENYCQIIDSENKMSFVDTTGFKHKTPLIRRYGMGNDTDANRIVTYEVIRGEIYKNVYDSKIDRFSLSYLEQFGDAMEIPKNAKEPLFMNNSQKISAEDYWYYLGPYPALIPSYVILKSRGKFGVWDLEEKKTVIPFNFDKIVPKDSHLYLTKNRLITCYPYVGLEPKYKILESYIQYYARFEYPNDRKGWVDRKGIEYFD